MSNFNEYDQFDGLGLAKLVQDKEMSPSELIEEAISRVEALNPKINAVIHKMYDLARDIVKTNLPQGPFHGVPFLLKDLMADYAGVPTRKGNRFHDGFIPKKDSEIVRRYKATGLVVLGKTNVPEFGLSPWTEPELFGPCNNPWDLTRTAGGSSGGSAAAVATHMVPLAHGNDGGGSIRMPASCCGIFGLKPTRGRNPIGPELSEAWHGLACDHVLTRSVRDSAAMLDATAGPEVGALHYAPLPQRPFLSEVGENPGRLRIAFTSEPFLPAVVHKDCVEGLHATVKLCQELGHEVVEATPQIDGKAFGIAFLTMQSGEIRADIESAETLLGRKATPKDYEPVTWSFGILGKQISSAAFALAIRQIQQTGRQISRFFEEYDVLLTPTLATPPVLTGTYQLKKHESFGLKVLFALKAERLIKSIARFENMVDQVFSFSPFTPIFNAAGLPAMSVPLHWNDKGLPVGMHFVARHGDEATLFRLASQLEQAMPWVNRSPLGLTKKQLPV